MLFDMVKAYNNHNISNRDEISYTFPEALGEIQNLFSYAYGDYQTVCINSYKFVDTVNFSLTGTNLDNSQFCDLTTQTKKDERETIHFKQMGYFC